MGLHRTGNAGAADYRVEVPQSRPRLLGLLVVSLVFVVLCGALAVGSASQSDISAFAGVMGVIGVAFFGLAVVFAAVRSVRGAPALVLDADGLHDNAAWAAAGTVPWSNIVVADATSFGMQSMLVVAVRDPQAVVAGTTGLRRMMLSANARMMSTPVNIPGILLPARPSELADEINTHLALLAPGEPEGEAHDR